VGAGWAGGGAFSQINFHSELPVAPRCQFGVQFTWIGLWRLIYGAEPIPLNGPYSQLFYNDGMGEPYYYDKITGRELVLEALCDICPCPPPLKSSPFRLRPPKPDGVEEVQL
jgi:hypothetical protein